MTLAHHTPSAPPSADPLKSTNATSRGEGVIPTPTATAHACVWSLPRGYTAHMLIHAVHHARTHPDDRYMTPGRDYLTAAEFLRWFRRCLHRKISAAGAPSRPLRGRKDGGDGYLSDWERAAMQTARRVNTPRLIVRATEVPLEFRERLWHRIWSAEDF